MNGSRINFIFQSAELGILPDRIYPWARGQLDYALGSNGRSFVVGVGPDPPVKVHHAAASCPDLPEPCGWEDYESAEPNPQVKKSSKHLITKIANYKNKRVLLYKA